MSTMTCVFAFLVWSLIPLLFPRATEFVAYISADIIQLVALPLIMVGQKLASDASATNHANLSDRTTEMMDVLDSLHTLVKENDEELDELKTILATQQTIIDQQAKILIALNK